VRTAALPIAGVALVAMLLAAAPSSAERKHDYVGVEKCRTCHEKELMGNQVATWSAGPHRGAFETLASPASVAIAAKLGIAEPPSVSEACLRCHQTAQGVSPVRIAHPLETSDGVQCESCHGPGRDYRKKKIMSERKKAEKKGLWDAGADAAICTTCHNEESPTFDPARYTRADGSPAGFDFEQAKGRILHEIPEHVKGRFIELEDAEKAREKALKAVE
jgi:hypothetical protein